MPSSRVEPGSPSRRVRRRRRLRWRAAVPLVAGLAGLMFAVSFQANRAAGGAGLRQEGRDLVGQLRAQNAQVARLSGSVASLTEIVATLEAQAAPARGQVKDLQDKASALSPRAGLVAVRGPGVTVTLDDAHRDPATLPDGFTPDDMVVHQQDVQAVVNALWAGGAEAMMLMDQRVVATSAVRCVGNTLLLQGRVYSPPFTIAAIGDPAALRRGLDASPEIGIYRQYVDRIGLGWDVTGSDWLDFPAYLGSIELKYAKVAS